MKYVCYECKKEISSNIDERFISKEGKCLCINCSKDVEPISKRELEIIKKYNQSEL